MAGPDDPAVPRHGFIPAKSVEEALADALKRHGPAASVAVVRNPQGV